MASKLVNIVKDFTLTIVRDGQLVKEAIKAGIQRLEEDVAEHWYTKAHSSDVPEGVTQTDEEAEAAASTKAAAAASKTPAKS
ncbi:hypothetical protein SAMN04487785_11314 [Dyella jiangningensis]|uniref:STY1053 family phage-associated protein n=1 Tax=Dyella sp. AtDHG13 TaxID=1938897 RepID=UPI00088ED417|nr:hypothetical protein [Dyella sp. AtDHG13]PXV60892.1 hypothetical protein BDW41_102623 [Dyella sp. AtDHG13]SDK94202.1 hypothetical protein SAMN04487785_11314 [Dyella jiangningensis]